MDIVEEKKDHYRLYLDSEKESEMASSDHVVPLLEEIKALCGKRSVPIPEWLQVDPQKTNRNQYEALIWFTSILHTRTRKLTTQEALESVKCYTILTNCFQSNFTMCLDCALPSVLCNSEGHPLQSICLTDDRDESTE